jgi:hypothetical protein
VDKILKALSENPDLIEAYTSEQITEARAALTEFAQAVRSGDLEADSDAIAEAKALSAKLDERSTALEAEAAARETEIADLETALGISAQDEESEPDDDEDSEDSPDEVEVPVDDPAEEVEESVEDEQVLVTASIRPGRLAAQIPAQRKPRPVQGPSLVASAAGLEGREVLTASALGEIMGKAWRGLPDSASPVRYSMAQYITEGQHKYSVVGHKDEDMRALADVAREASESGNLVASGGFCAPAEQLYGFFNIATRAGILTLPTVNAPRGAISLPVSPTLADFIGATGIATEWTNDNDLEPTSPASKPEYIFVCPDFQECEVSAWPTVLQFGNFAARFFPEAIANATSLALIAADRTVNAARIAALVGASSAGTVEATGGGGLINLSRNLASNSAEYRQTYGMDPTAVLEVVLPHWVPRALWSDAIARDSTVEYGDLRRRISGMFNELDLRVQYVYDFDPMVADTFPETTDVLMYAPGTFVELDGGTLDLGVVRDSILNATNDFQVFSEPFVGWCQPGHEVRLLDEVGICASGETGTRVDLAC